MSEGKDNRQEIPEIKSLESQLLKTHEDLTNFIEKAESEYKNAGEASSESKAAVEKLTEKAEGLSDRIADLEQSQAKHFEGQQEATSPGSEMVKSEQFQNMVKNREGRANIEVKTAIVNAATPSMSQPLVPGHRLDTVVTEPDRELMIRDLLPRGSISSNTVFFPKENTFTNNADVVRDTSVSPIVAAENVTKPESAITFTSGQEAVVTIAHFIPISKQALDDSPFVESFVNQRMVYGVNLKEEEELVNGTGVTGYISGLWTSRTAYAQADSPHSYTTNIDFIRDAKRQAQQSNYAPSVVLMNPKDWSDIELQKETTGGYIFANPQGVATSMLWGMRVVASNTMTAGRFIVMAPRAVQVWDRETTNIAISYEDSTNFQKNMATIRAEKRLAFTVYNAGGIIGGTFS